MDVGAKFSCQNKKVAIVGIGCRYGNGVNNVRKFWEMLVEGLDCTTPIPPDRFDASYFLSPGEKTAGKMYIQKGGYISQDPTMFDRQFFKMPPDEAAHLDPQVRLLLEVTWEALENAGITPSALRGSDTGVYMGVTAQDYSLFMCKPLHNMNQYSNSGCNSCMVANRISYEFDLHGPSFAVDTACSSSLYSIYLACEALNQKSCSMALAGGVNLILVPNTTVGFCQAGMLSGDGKCKSFDQAADGYSRSEGAGVLVLKPLDEALKNNDRVYAVLTGGALSNDGRTPGIANPSFTAQVELMKKACQNARVDPLEIVYAEAHGTGTRVGDTTEAGALGEVMGKHRGAQHPPLYIGSVKSNLGHSEGAAGVAGIIKVALCLHQRKIPRVAHFETPNENVDFQALNIRVPTKTIPWPRGSRLLACCSSFGFGGANANITLEGLKTSHFDRISQTNNKTEFLSPLLLSAASTDALHQKITDWVEFLSENSTIYDTNFYSYLYTAAVRSQHLSRRIGFAVRSKEDALLQLQMKLQDETQVSPGYVEGMAPSIPDTTRPIVFVFSGMGTQWWGMARELMHTQPVFASKIKVMDKMLRNSGAKWSLDCTLSEEEDQDKIHQTEISQPCLFAVAVGLMDLWKMRGVVPDAVVGHSVGEVAAAYAAGLLSLENAVKLIYRRGRELSKTSGSGKMVAVLHRVKDTLSLAESSRHGQLLDVAAINSPSQVVFSGKSSAIEGLVHDLRSENIKCVELKVNNAFHSKQQEVVKGSFLTKVGEFLKMESGAARNNTIPMMSTVTGRYLTVEEANSPEYWFQNVRQKVSFMNAVQNLAKDGYRVFVEIGPHTSLLPALRDTFADLQGAEGSFITTGSLVRPRDTSTTARDSENLLMSQMKLHVKGVSVDFSSFFHSSDSGVVSIPHYPWQREKCTNITKEARKELLFPVEEGGHLLLGEPQETYSFHEYPVKIWRSDLNASKVPWLKDHVVQGTVIMPAAAFAETALAAAQSLFNNQYPVVLNELKFDRFMFTPDAEGCLESTVEEKAPETLLFTARSYDVTKGEWTYHCHMTIIPPFAAHRTELQTSATIDVQSIQQRCTMSQTQSDFYSLIDGNGFKLGPTFKGVQTVLLSEDYREGLLYAEAPPGVQRDFHCYVYHPAYLDTLLHGSLGLLSGMAKIADRSSRTARRQILRVPRSIKSLSVFAAPSTRALIHIKVCGTKRLYWDIDIADVETKRIFCSFRELAVEPIQTEKMEPQVWSTSWKSLGSLEITGRNPDASTYSKNMIIFTDDTDLSVSLVHVVKKGNQNVEVYGGENATTQTVQSVLSKSQDSDKLLVIMKTEAVSICLDSGLVMSQTNFEEYQERSPLFCLSVLRALQLSAVKSKFLLITKGAYHVRDKDEIHPFSAIMSAVGLTVSHEEPSIGWYHVDLPMTASSEECCEVLLEIICREEYFLHSENCISVRGSEPTENGTHHGSDQTWEFLSPRLKVEDISKTHEVVSTENWSVSIQTVSNQDRVSVQKPRFGTTSDCYKEGVNVKVEAFALSTKEMLRAQNIRAPLLCLYSGEIEDKSDERGASKRVLGLTVCKEVSPVMTSTSRNLVDMPAFLTSEEAVSIVWDNLSSLVFFNQTLQISSAMRLVFKVDSLDSDALATVRVACKLGAEVVLLKNDDSDQDMTNLDIDVNYLNEVADASVDVLFLSTKPTSLDSSIYSLLPKVKGNATIVIMQRQKQETRLKMPPSKIKLVVFDADFPSAVNGLTFEELSNYIADLWRMFKPQLSDGNFVYHSPTCKRLSLLATATGDVPEDKVICVDEKELFLPLSLESDGFVADETSAYFITGGTKGFGLKLLQWLVSRGARFIYTASRGQMTDELKNVIEESEKYGAHVCHIQMDVSNAGDVERELMKMKDGPPNRPALKGIFHCAAVFSDAFVQNITTESWNSVMAPKAYGALLLHQLTLKLGIQLEHFVLTSSIVSLLGNAGQGSYCAANIFLNSLSQYRKSKGLPATAVQIGLINSTGFAVRQNLVQLWENNGIVSLNPEEVLGSIGCALALRQPQLGISGYFSQKDYAERHRGLMVQHFREKHGTMSVIKDLYNDSDLYLTATDDDLLHSIIQLPPTNAQEVVLHTLSKLLSKLLGLKDEVSPDVSPISMGVDSLMASEVSQMISQQFQVTVGAVDLLNNKNTIRELSKRISRDILAKRDSATSDGPKKRESASTQKALVVEGDPPRSLAVKLVCFPSTGAGPSLFAPLIVPLLQHGIQLLMVQLPGWEGREDEKPLTDMDDIIKLIHGELVSKLSGLPFAFFGHSMGSLIAFEVAHLLFAENGMCPHHLFVSAWHAPTAPYPHPADLQIEPSVFEKLNFILKTQPKLFVGLWKEGNINLSFLDDSFLQNTVLMQRLVPCLEAGLGMVSRYTCKHQKPLPCDITAFGGTLDKFASSELLDIWQLQRSREQTFKKIMLPGKHFFILTNTSEIVKEIIITCKKVLGT